MNGNSSKFPASLLAAPTSITVFLLVTVLLMSSAGGNKTGAPNATASAGNESKNGDTQTPLPVSSVLQLLKDYQGESSGLSPSAQSKSGGETAAAKSANDLEGTALSTSLIELKSLKPDEVGVKNIGSLKCLIALVPDPLDSHLPLTFDNAISSIVQAFREHGFVRDRQAFLWQYGGKGASEAALVAPWREQPSAILFRKAVSTGARSSRTQLPAAPQNISAQEATSELVLVLLVGETPTAGIHRTAFFRALDFVTANHLSVKDATNRLCVPIIGPTFSGSSDSLQLSIRQWFARLPETHKPERIRHVELQIVSGSATATENKDFLDFKLDGNYTLTSKYHATVLPDVATKELLLKHLVVEHGMKPERIAILTEDTAYGSSSNKSTSGSNNSKSGSVRVIPFPLSLSRMRSEYQKSEKANGPAGDSAANKLNVQRRNVTLESESTNKAVDAIPTFSSVTPATADLALARILETIKQEEIQAVGIMATDVQDVLFLARQVRMYSPDVLLFTTENEVLYTHSDLANYMRGMLVAATYPLSTRVDGWYRTAGPEQPNLAFPSSSAQGIYNATIGQLNSLLPEQRPLRGYQMPLSTSQGPPPLWLSVVTEAGIWPVSVMSTGGLEEGAQKAVLSTMFKPPNPEAVAPKFSLVSISRVPSLCFALAGALVIVFSLLHSGKRPRQGRLNKFIAQNLLPFSEIGEPDLTPSQLERRVIITLALLAIALVECLLISPLLLYWTSSSWLSGSRAFSFDNYISPRHAFADGVIVVFCLAVLVVSLGVTLATIFQLAKYIQKISYADGYITKLVVLLGLGLAWMMVIAVAARPALGSNLELVLFLDRAGELASGISPIMPMVAVIVAILIWSLGQWSRSCAGEECFFEPPFAATDASNTPLAPEAQSISRKPATVTVGVQEVIQLATAGVGRKLEDLRAHAQLPHSFKLRTQDILFCCLVVMNALYLYFHWVSTFEGRLYDSVFMALSAIALVMFLTQFLYLKAICQSLLDLLRTLAQHPILPGFERAPQRLRDKVSDQLFCKVPSESDLNQQMRAFAHACEKLKIKNRAEVKSLMISYAALAVANTELQVATGVPAADDNCKIRKERWRKVCKFRTDLAAVTREYILPRLLKYWIDKDSASTPVDSASTNKSKTVGADPWQAQADAELCVVIALLSIIRSAFLFMRNALIALIGMLLCFMVAFQSYPFVIRTSLQSSLTWITCWVAASLVLVMVQLNRNEVLSRIGKSVPNRFQLDGSFVKPMLTYVALPVLGLLTIQFPGLSRFLFGWLGGLSQFFTM